MALSYISQLLAKKKERKQLPIKLYLCLKGKHTKCSPQAFQVPLHSAKSEAACDPQCLGR